MVPARRNVLVVVLYRSGSVAITNVFFDDLADVLERAMAYSCPFILLGDVNIHLDVLTNPGTIKWQSTLDSYSLIQHVTRSTHRAGHTIDVIVTQPHCPVNDVSVQAPTLSDHSFITANVDLQFGRGRFAGSIRRRQWLCFDYDAFPQWPLSIRSAA